MSLPPFLLLVFRRRRSRSLGTLKSPTGLLGLLELVNKFLKGLLLVLSLGHGKQSVSVLKLLVENGVLVLEQLDALLEKVLPIFRGSGRRRKGSAAHTAIVSRLCAKRKSLCVIFFGLKGILNEAELEGIKRRLVEAVRQKAERGELALTPPVGLVR